jgi:hypothetical protein
MSIQGPLDPEANRRESQPSDIQGGKRPSTRMTAKRRYAMTPKAMAAPGRTRRGPLARRSVAGKERSRRNALRHGLTAFAISILVPGEDAMAYDELYQTLLREYPPFDATGQFAVLQLTNALWRTRRIDMAETAVVTQEPHRAPNAPFRWEPGFAIFYVRIFYPGLFEKVCAPTPMRIEDTDQQFWSDVRTAALRLGRVIPEIARFCVSRPPKGRSRRFATLSCAWGSASPESTTRRMHFCASTRGNRHRWIRALSQSSRRWSRSFAIAV